MTLDELARLAQLIKLNGEAIIDLAKMLPSFDPNEVRMLGEVISSAAKNLSNIASSFSDKSAVQNSLGAQDSAYALTTLNGCFIGANEPYLRIVQREKHELFEKTILDITHYSDRRKNHDLLQELVHNRRNFNIKKKYLLPDASTIWVENEVQRLTDDTGREFLLARCRPLLGG